MKGIVRSREAWIKVRLRGKTGRLQGFDAVIDTGFSGWLTLPIRSIKSLGLEWHGEREGMLADGTKSTFNVYWATVEWNRQLHEILVGESESIPLIGMSLLAGCELKIQVRQGGKVTIKPLPPTRSRR